MICVCGGFTLRTMAPQADGSTAPIPKSVIGHRRNALPSTSSPNLTALHDLFLKHSHRASWWNGITTDFCFESRPGHRLIMVLLSSSKKIQGHNLEIDHYSLISNPFNSSFITILPLHTRYRQLPKVDDYIYIY